jgi:hypothetical protein
MRKRRFFPVGVLTLSGAFFHFAPAYTQGSGQEPAPSSAQSQVSVPSPAQPPTKRTTPATAPAKPGKVWTNENLAEANGPVSVVGDPKKPAKGAPGSAPSADPQYIANTRKQLEKLQSELADTNKKLVDLKDFLAGESVSYSGYQYRKGYDREPVDAQIHNLEEKKKQTQAKIDALLEEARRKGVEPGQLR